MASTSETPAVLAHSGGVPLSYTHHDKAVTPGEPLVLPQGLLKWYLVADPGVADDGEANSREFTRQLFARGSATLEYGMGFVIVHRASQHDFLFIGGWHGHNEWWMSAYHRAAGSDAPWTLNPQDAYRPIACVWELVPIWHERNAWVQYLKSARDLAARKTWLADRMTAVL